MVVEHCEYHGKIEEKVNQLETRVDKIDEMLEKVRQRPPVWATFAFSVLLGVIGWLAGKI
jgi:hypothetical protein